MPDGTSEEKVLCPCSGQECKDARVAAAAKRFVYAPDNWEGYERLKRSISMDIPVEFIDLCYIVAEEYGPPQFGEDENEEPPTRKRLDPVTLKNTTGESKRFVEGIDHRDVREWTNATE